MSASAASSLTRIEPRAQTTKARASLLLRETPPAPTSSLLPALTQNNNQATWVNRLGTRPHRARTRDRTALRVLGRAVPKICYGRGGVSSQATCFHSKRPPRGPPPRANAER